MYLLRQRRKLVGAVPIDAGSVGALNFSVLNETLRGSVEGVSGVRSLLHPPASDGDVSDLVDVHLAAVLDEDLADGLTTPRVIYASVQRELRTFQPLDRRRLLADPSCALRLLPIEQERGSLLAESRGRIWRFDPEKTFEAAYHAPQ